MAQTRTRLDTLLAERGLYESRSRAAAAVLAGDVLVGPGRERAAKPGTMVDAGLEVALRAPPRFVSRGGLKLERAIDVLGVPVRGRSALDVGASTGGFTDMLLGAGAARVTAVDVGYGDLHHRLRRDPRVTVLERVNARHLVPEDIPYRPDLIVVDVSFIGLAKVLPALSACAAPQFDLLALVKPQFEAGRGRVGRGGVVRARADRLAALVGVGRAARAEGISVLGYAGSGLPGPAGNRETFIWCADPSRAGIQDLEVAAAAADADTPVASGPHADAPQAEAPRPAVSEPGR